MRALGAGRAVLAFDVGGTDMKAALVDEAGDIRDIVRVPTPIHGELIDGEPVDGEPVVGEPVVREPVDGARMDGEPIDGELMDGEKTAGAVVIRIGQLARELQEKHPDVHPQGAGLLVPGHVDDKGGIGLFSENLGWKNYPFRDRVEAVLRVPVSLGHDVRGAGEAEYRLGAAEPFRDVVVMVIGTGIAGAVFIQGTLYTGGGMAGEVGHSKVADGPQCACGGLGCLEAVASAGAIARRYTQVSGQVVSGAKDVLERAASGDIAAKQIWEGALDALALDLSHTVALLAPEAIVIGGGLSQAGSVLFEPLERRLDAILTFQRRPRLLRASIGADAGVIGAALRARDLLDKKAGVP